MNLSKLETFEAVGLVSVVMINKIILNFPKIIIKDTGSSAWISTILISIIAIFFAYLIATLFKKFPGQDILDVSNYLGKGFLKISIGLTHIVCLIIVSALIVRNFSESLKIIYFNTSPLIYLLLFFVVSACIVNKFGIKAISKANLIITPIISISILIIFISASKNFVFQHLFPVLGYGVNETFFSSLTDIFGFTGLAYLLYLKPLLKNEKDFKKVSIYSMIISGIYLLLSILCLLLVFSFITDSTRTISIYLLAKAIKYGEFIQRANTLFIFVFILSILSYVSIVVFFSVYITKKLTNLSNTNSINYCYCSIIFGIALIYENATQYIDFIEGFLKYIILLFLFIVNIGILIVANIKFNRASKISKKSTT